MCFKCISEGRFLFNVKIINASLKFLIKMPTQKAKFLKNLCINEISQTNFKSFSNQHSDIASILSSLNSSLPLLSYSISFFYMKHVVMLGISFKSHLIRHSGTGRVFKDTLRALEHLRHSESTQRALGHLRHLGYSGTWALEALYLAESKLLKQLYCHST